MSWEERWVLPRSVDTYQPTALAGIVREFVPSSAEVTGSANEHGVIVIRVSFPEEDWESVGTKLAGEDYLDWAWADEVDPPARLDRYILHVELREDKRPVISVYSNDAENGAAWPLAYTIAARLAAALEAVDEDELPPDSDHVLMFVEPSRKPGQEEPN